ncbi:MAG TPA: hypothetical protein VIS94_10660 [Desulfomonilia bacterium]
MKSKLEIYALAVCFTSVVCLVISVGIAGYNIIEIINPELTIGSYVYNTLQSNDSFWESRKCNNESKVLPVRPPEEELSKKRKEALAIALKGEKREGFQSLVKTLMFILAGGIALLVHWKIAKKART